MFKFAQHDVVKDTVTGFKGMVVGRTEWDNGCIRYTVQSHRGGPPIHGDPER